MDEFDYIVVGAGSAGCVAAGRLVAEQGARVLLLEEGAQDRGMLIKMPAGAFKIMTGAGGFLKTYRSVPQASLDGRSIDIAQARVLGGGSSVNALVYTRGAREDYDAWDRELGGAGWGWNDILPHFKRQEGNQRLSNDSHGSAGPLKVSDFRNICRISEIFIPTMEALGIQRTDDFNAGDERGVGFFQGTLFRSKRFSAANAFLDPVRTDKNLSLKTNAAVTRIVIEDGRAVGVEFRHAGRSRVARCRRDIILAAGAYASPKLLLLSGIGPAAELARHGIAVQQDLPGVGQNMQDHPIVTLAAYTKGRYGYFGEERGFRLILNLIRYFSAGKGPIASNGSESVAFVNLDDPSALPDLQIYNIGTMWLAPGQGTPDHGLTLMAGLVRPKSRGWMRLSSANPLDPVEISPNFLEDPDDLRRLVAGFRYMRTVLAARPLADIVRRELVPGNDVASEEDIIRYVKASTITNYHPVGSCRMGRRDDPMAVVDAELKVRGVAGLRVFDASVFPLIPSANTNAPTMAVADRGVDILLGHASVRV